MRISIRNSSGIVIEKSIVRQAVKAVLAGEGETQAPVVLVTNDAIMIDYNMRFMGRDRTTDVLAFPDEDEEDYLGDMLINAEVAQREALKRRLPFERELTLYAIHGSLHLIGYEDKTTEGKRKMRQLERNYLKALGW